MNETTADIQANLLGALAHPNRIRILEELRDGVKCNCELAPVLKLEQPNLSRHLKMLVQAGALVSWKEGLRVNFKVADRRVYTILDIALKIAKEGIEKKVEMFEEA